MASVAIGALRVKAHVDSRSPLGEQDNVNYNNF